ncbi:MAG: hypothetical protein ACRC1G_11520 [Bradyrhizobium sp.]|nr:hypothetical protein [Bradyrhizobium sp.]
MRKRAFVHAGGNRDEEKGSSAWPLSNILRALFFLNRLAPENAPGVVAIFRT